MDTTSNEAMAELRMRLHDYMLGYARVDAARMGTLDRRDWALAARVEQLRRHPLVAMLDDELLAAIASRGVDPCVEARYLVMRLREAEEEAAAEAGLAPPRGHAERPRRPDLPSTALAQMEATLRIIARGHLGFETLETRHRDSLDFRSCSVGCVRAALVEAYEEGWRCGLSGKGGRVGRCGARPGADRFARGAHPRCGLPGSPFAPSRGRLGAAQALS